MIRTTLAAFLLVSALSADTITQTITSGAEEACQDGIACAPITLDVAQVPDLQGPVTWTFTDTQQYLIVYDGGYADVGEYLGEPYTTTEGDTSQALDLIVSTTQQNIVTGVFPWFLTNQFQASGTLDPSLLEGDGILPIQITPSCSDFAEVQCIVIDSYSLSVTYDPMDTSPVPEPRVVWLLLGLLGLCVLWRALELRHGARARVTRRGGPLMRSAKHFPRASAATQD